jgi:precorrin-6Y C5,15-methyltransferase (decarboxylating)
VSGARIVVVGIGADGWTGLSEPARTAILAADEVIGSERQLATLPDDGPPRRAWPSPMGPLLAELTSRSSGNVCVLASGDPMLHGIGATLVRRVGVERLHVIPQASAFSLACARLGWPAAEVELVSAVAADPDRVARLLQPGRRLVVYATGSDGAAKVAGTLRRRGFGASRFVVLEQLGAEHERVHDSTAAEWGERLADPLHAVAIQCAPDASTDPLPLTPGLPDDAYEHDGQLTKRHVRAITLAALAVMPGQVLWDVGAGSGSIGIEWLRAEASARAVAVERHAERAELISRNAAALGVPDLVVVHGTAPAALAGLERPDAVFIGGGVSAPDTLEQCFAALAPGGRLVANAVTLESETRVLEAQRQLGGALTRIEIAHAEPIGSFTGWRPQMPVVQWSVRKTSSDRD